MRNTNLIGWGYLLLMATLANAGTVIPITSGTADNDMSTGQFAVMGPGLVFTGRGGTLRPGPCGLIQTCRAGTSRRVLEGFSSEGWFMGGSVWWGGKWYGYSFGPGFRGDAGLDLYWTLDIPPLDSRPARTVTIVSPFWSFGGFYDPNAGLDFYVAGQGTVTVTLEALPWDPAEFELRSAHYEFTAVPEPATATLMLTALMLAGAFLPRRPVTARNGRKPGSAAA